jgi:hypothetical protein
MTSLPWLLIPGFLVPSLFFTHLVIFYRLFAKTEALEPGYVWPRGGHAKAS